MTTDQSHRLILEQIARRAMLERGLLPDFSAESLAELDRIHSPATARPGAGPRPEGTALGFHRQ